MNHILNIIIVAGIPLLIGSLLILWPQRFSKSEFALEVDSRRLGRLRVIGILLLLIATVLGTLSVMNPPPPPRKDQVQTLSEQINSQCPIHGDEITTLTSTMYTNNIFTFNFTLSKIPPDKEKELPFIKLLERGVREAPRVDPVVDSLLKNRVQVDMNYFTFDGKLYLGVTLDPSDYAFNPLKPE